MSVDVDDQRTLIAKPRTRPAPHLFKFGGEEAVAGATLLEAGGRLVYSIGDPTPAGFVGLYDRGLVIPVRGRDGLAIEWATPDAPAVIARHLCRYYNHGTYLNSILSKRLTKETSDQITVPELAVVLAWHYRYTDVCSLHLTRSGDVLALTEHRSHHRTRTHRIPTAPTMAPSWALAGTDDYADQGHVLTDRDLDTYTRLLAARTRAADEGVVLHLDTLTVRPFDWEPATFAQTLPAMAQDALACLSAPDFANRDEFIAWAEESLTLTLACGRNRHHLIVDPHTHALSPFPATAKTRAKHDGEHLLAALTDGTETACEAARTALDLFGDAEQYESKGLSGARRASALTTARILARTVQYLDAGLDMDTVAPFLRHGLTADQTRGLLALQASDPAEVRDRLLRAAKFHWISGPVTVDNAPIC